MSYYTEFIEFLDGKELANNMKSITIKKTCYVLILLTTFLLALNIIDIILVFKTKTEVALLDFFPYTLRLIVAFTCPILLFISYTLFIISSSVKMKFDFQVKILFFINFVSILSVILFFCL